jgi:serine/threonine protein kinase
MWCIHCGVKLRDNAKFCHQCGASQTPVIQTGPLRPGDTFQGGRYQILRPLGRGGMGAIYLADDTRLVRRCVLKEMLPDYTSPEDRQKAETDFQREARTLALLNQPGHPNIPEIFDYFIEKGRHYLVMKYIGGENLEERLKRRGRPLSEENVVEWAIQVCDALAYMHGRKPEPVVHRDIKPANLILDEDGRLWLVDFGLVRAMPSSRTQTNGGGKTVAIGTPGYTPPEQWLQEPEPRSDIYALGASLHHLLSGHDPRDAFAQEDVLTPAMVLGAAPFPPIRKLNKKASAAMERMIRAAMEPEVYSRPTAAELKTELEAIARRPGTQPFTFKTGDIANSVKALVQICDTNWDTGKHHLLRGDIEHWLKVIGRYDLASKTESLRSSVKDEDLKQEIVLQQLDSDLPLPLLRASHKHLDLHKTGLGHWGETLILYNRQRGYKGGKIAPNVSWLDLSDERFRLVGKGARQEIDLSVDYRRLPFGRRHEGELEVQPSQGQRIKVTFLLEMSALDFVAQVVRVMGKGTGKLRRNIQAAHRKTRRPVELHLLLIAFGAFLGFISLQEVGLAVAGVVMGPFLVYTLLLGGLWSRGVVQAARGLGKDQKNNHP